MKAKLITPKNKWLEVLNKEEREREERRVAKLNCNENKTSICIYDRCGTEAFQYKADSNVAHVFRILYFFYDSYIENHRSVESSRTKTKKVTFYAIYLTCRKMKMNEVKDTKMTVSLSIYLGSLAID